MIMIDRDYDWTGGLIFFIGICFSSRREKEDTQLLFETGIIFLFESYQHILQNYLIIVVCTESINKQILYRKSSPQTYQIPIERTLLNKQHL